ncbi:MAG: hypothetical protein NZ824_12275 [Candidatus Thioglobus sp.]|nr:hypothetical protein [Candidatus Thioglobus sp.]
MARVHPFQSNFTSGELSPRLEGQIDFKKYANGCSELTNMLVYPHGGARRRGGTYFVAEVKDSSKDVRLVPFEFNVTQSYVLEFGDTYIRFYKDNGQIVSGSAAYEIASPYSEAELFELHFAQSADVMYICHSNHAPRKLSRTGHAAWTLTTPTFTWNPILATAFTVGEVYTITDLGNTDWTEQDAFTTTVPAAVGSVFTASHVGTGTGRAWTSPWNSTNGYPRTVTFYEQRLFLAGTSAQPQTIWGSQTADYENFDQGEGLADESLEYAIATNRVNVIRWLQPSRDLIVGTGGGEFKVGRPTGQPLTPSNVLVSQQTTYGSWTIPPIQIGSAILFTQRARRKMREFSYMYQSDGYVAPDMTLLAEHITEGYLKDIDYQQEPDSIVWACTEDGSLLSMTYERPEDVIAWAGHDLGGADAKVGSVAVITNTTQDQLWVVVERTVNNATKKYVEYLDPNINVDSGLTGTVAASATSIGNLGHLEGETVNVVIDGAVFPNEVVSNGAITPTIPSTWTGNVDIEVGLPYISTLKTMRIEAGSQSGKAQGRKKRWNEVMVRLLDTTGVNINGDQIPFRSSADAMDSKVSSFTGDKRVSNLGWDRDGIIEIKQEQPLPLTVLAIHGTLTTSD